MMIPKIAAETNTILPIVADHRKLSPRGVIQLDG